MGISLRFALAVAGCVTLLTIAGSTYACGENKFRAGHGLKYQAYKATVPGTVLVMTSSKRSLASRALKKAGHHVVVVNSENAMRQALVQDHYNVVIVPYETLTNVDQSSAPKIQSFVLPYVRGRANLATAQDTYGAAISTVSGGREIIGLVNAIVESQV